jgi:hypothetical protein
VPSSHDDQGNLWMVKEAYGSQPCMTGEPVACGSVVGHLAFVDIVDYQDHVDVITDSFGTRANREKFAHTSCAIPSLSTTGFFFLLHCWLGRGFLTSVHVQEVSCFDRRDDGDGNDNWKLECTASADVRLPMITVSFQIN